ncbi:hypothetical protein DV735_g1370, partial [Chaetothyriales sp. CBS 134920]
MAKEIQDAQTDEPRAIGVRSGGRLARKYEYVLFYLFAIASWSLEITSGCVGSLYGAQSHVFIGTIVPFLVLYWAAFLQTVWMMATAPRHTIPDRIAYLNLACRLQRLCAPSAVMGMVIWAVGYRFRHSASSQAYWVIFLIVWIASTVVCMMNVYNNVTWESDLLHQIAPDYPQSNFWLGVFGIWSICQAKYPPPGKEFDAEPGEELQTLQAAWRLPIYNVMSDRRRVNGPPAGTLPPVFLEAADSTPRQRTRKAHELRRIFLQTGLIPSAAGSSYFELELAPQPRQFVGQPATVKLSCAVHGPKPLPRNASFSPNLQLTASVKFAPFATSERRGYIRDATERDLGVHLENALKAMLLPTRWPKSAIDVAITVLEAEGDASIPSQGGSGNVIASVGLMNILSGCITAASAALADARIDAVDLLTGGVVAVVSDPRSGQQTLLLDPNPTEHESVVAAGVVGVLPSRDEVAEIWTTGQLSSAGSAASAIGFDRLLDQAVIAAKAVQPVLKDALLESAKRVKQPPVAVGNKGKGAAIANNEDVEMAT